MLFIASVCKRYPLKAVRTFEKKEEAVEEENQAYSLQTEPTWKHEAFSGTGLIPCARCKSILWEAPEKGAYHQRRDSSKRIEPGKVRFCF